MAGFFHVRRQWMEKVFILGMTSVALTVLGIAVSGIKAPREEQLPCEYTVVDLQFGDMAWISAEEIYSYTGAKVYLSEDAELIPLEIPSGYVLVERNSEGLALHATALEIWNLPPPPDDVKWVAPAKILFPRTSNDYR